MSPFLIIIFLWVYDMTTRRESTRRVEEQVSNGGALTQGKQDPPQDNQDLSQEKNSSM